MGTVIDIASGRNFDRHQRWDRTRRAARCDQYRDLQAQGRPQRQAAKRLQVPRSPLQAWRTWHDPLDACPQVGELFHSGPGLASLHRLVMAFHGVCVEMGACGMRLVGLFLERTGRNRCVGASCGTQQRLILGVAAAMGAYRREETQRLAQAMTPLEKGETGPSRGATTSCEDLTPPGSVQA